MIWALSIAIVFLTIFVILQSAKISVLRVSLNDTNTKLNETRELVAKHHKQLRHL